MNVTRFEPWSLLSLMQRDFERAAGRNGSDDTGTSVADWVPAVDIVEEKERFVLKADLPGVRPDNIDVKMDDGVLSLSGERTHENSSEIDGLRRVERASGKFYRRFSLPDTANAEEISAKSADGILEISIPKVPQIQARRITVEAA
jgi:HSP20 family protein